MYAQGQGHSQKTLVDFTSWGITKSIDQLLLEFAQNVVVANFLSIIMDEAVVIDNNFWISLHLYVFQNWKQIPL